MDVVKVTQPLLTVAEVAQSYNVSDETVRRWMRKGIIGYVMVGPFRARRIPKDEAERHFAAVPGAATGGSSV